MNQLYRFSPITSEADLEKVWNYLTMQLENLSQEVLHEKLPISILKVFPHYEEEFTFLHQLISHMGPETSYSSKTSLYVKVDKLIRGHHITALGVRFVDPYRMQVGCGDYEVDDFAFYREKQLGTSPYIREVKDSTDMLELWHPDYDVLGYIVPKE